MQRIAIIGGGLSGTLMAIRLLQSASQRHIDLVETSPDVGLGAAYGTVFADHLLNVPAQNMSLFPDCPLHFCQWLGQHHPGIYHPDDFVPRLVFGKYVRETFQSALAAKPESVSLKIHQARAVDALEKEDGVQLKLDNGDALTADRVILALGNPPPNNPVHVEAHWETENRYVGNPWAAKGYDSVQSLQSILLIGSGLTALDFIAAAHRQGFRGVFHVVSSHGRFPLLHSLPVAEHTLSRQPDELAPATVRELVRWFKCEMQLARGDWRAVLQAFRPWVPLLWRRLPLSEKALFNRRLGSLWNVHRHRAAGSVLALVGGLQQAQQLFLHRGRVHSLEFLAHGMEIRVRTHNRTRNLFAERVVNCTGPCTDIEKNAVNDPLLQSLLASGSIRADALRMGMDALPDGQLLDAQGRPSPRYYTVGPPLKGVLFECTAVPEIREQAEKLAVLLSGKSFSRGATAKA